MLSSAKISKLIPVKYWFCEHCIYALVRKGLVHSVDEFRDKFSTILPERKPEEGATCALLKNDDLWPNNSHPSSYSTLVAHPEMKQFVPGMMSWKFVVEDTKENSTSEWYFTGTEMEANGMFHNLNDKSDDHVFITYFRVEDEDQEQNSNKEA